MMSSGDLLREMQRQGLEYFVGVPDSLLASFSAELMNLPPSAHVTAVSEGAAIGCAIGYHLATGRIPLVYMQNSGLGNATNPLTSLADPAVYAVPIVLLIGWRGAPGEADEPQHAKQGRITPAMLQALEIPLAVLEAGCDDAAQIVAEAVSAARTRSGPAAILVRKGALVSQGAAPATSSYPLDRASAIAAIVGGLDANCRFVATTGLAGRELYHLRDSAGMSHATDFLCVGGMGLASQVALGLATARPERRVVCLDGDGAVLMHMGGLAAIATAGADLIHIVLNNGAHASVGGQPTVGFKVDLPGVARALGYAGVFSARSAGELTEALEAARRTTGPVFLEVRIGAAERPGLGRPGITPVNAKSQFMGEI